MSWNPAIALAEAVASPIVLTAPPPVPPPVSPAVQQNSLDWQLKLLGQRCSEAVENWLRASQPPQPDLAPPPLNPWWWPPLEFWRVLFWGIVAMLALLVLWLLWQALDNNWKAYREMRISRDRLVPVTDIPVNSNRWLKQAQQLARQKNYPEACRALYFATLDQLHELQWVNRKDSRTDGEYGESVQGLGASIPPRSNQAAQTLLTTHEQLCFSDRPIGVDHFDQCQQAYQQVSAIPAKPVDSQPRSKARAKARSKAGAAQRKSRRWF